MHGKKYLSNVAKIAISAHERMRSCYDVSMTQTTRKGVSTMSERMLQAKDVARILNVDEKYFRSFLRDVLTDTPGRGGRYVIPETQVETICDRFAAWTATRNGGRTIIVNLDDIAEADE
jgi:hypothetical protein